MFYSRVRILTDYVITYISPYTVRNLVVHTGNNLDILCYVYLKHLKTSPTALAGKECRLCYVLCLPHTLQNSSHSKEELMPVKT